MKRRNFTKVIGAAVVAFAPKTVMAEIETEGNICRRRHTLLKPVRIQAGSVISLIAPSSPISEEKYMKALHNLNSLGFVVKPGKYVLEKTGYLAGTEQQRLEDLHAAFADPETSAVWCLRGGYGSARMLAQIDYELIRKHSKPFIGYSDVTALHLALHQKAGIVTYHGPVAASDFTEPTVKHFKNQLMLPSEGYTIYTPKENDLIRGDEYRPYIIRPGTASGALIGGNLSLLSALVGTDYAPDYNGKIVFIEDVGEKPYRIDRMLTQMLQGSNLGKAAGIILGVFADCVPKPDDNSWTLKETLTDRLAPLKIPVMYGFPFGHISDQATFPYGLQARLDTFAGSLTFADSGVA
jgi:muramoyltetrapeptide carboxypeptidase